MTTLASSTPTPTRAERWADFAERVAWTAIQAAGAAAVTVLTTGVEWQEGLLFVGITTLLAICKVAAAQQFGDGLGDIKP